MKTFVLVSILAVSSIGTTFAQDSCSAKAVKASAVVQHTKAKADIVDTAVAAGSFKTLVSLVKSAGLVDVLKGDGPFTVFAPTDAAFAKVPKATLEKLGKDKELLKKVLTYHVVAGNVMAKDVVKLNSAKTVEGNKVNIMVKKGSVFLNKTTKVVKTDIKTSNGTIHVIDSVLLPPM
jgi:uncharacterized surface protein with fasciclin (FAS1) repeats